MREESTNGGSEEHHSGNGTTENGHDVSTEQVSNHRSSFHITRMVHTKGMLISRVGRTIFTSFKSIVDNFFRGLSHSLFDLFSVHKLDLSFL